MPIFSQQMSNKVGGGVEHQSEQLMIGIFVAPSLNNMFHMHLLGPMHSVLGRRVLHFWYHDAGYLDVVDHVYITCFWKYVLPS